MLDGELEFDPRQFTLAPIKGLRISQLCDI